MTAKKAANSYGLTLKEIAERVNVSVNTPRNWYNDNRALFEAVCRGLVAVVKVDNSNQGRAPLYESKKRVK